MSQSSVVNTAGIMKRMHKANMTMNVDLVTLTATTGINLMVLILVAWRAGSMIATINTKLDYVIDGQYKQLLSEIAEAKQSRITLYTRLDDLAARCNRMEAVCAKLPEPFTKRNGG